MLEELFRKRRRRDYVNRIVCKGVDQLKKNRGKTTAEELFVVVSYDGFYWSIVEEAWKEIQKKAKKKGVRVEYSRLRKLKNQCLIFSYID